MSDVGTDDCVILNKCIYGLVQAAKQYYKKTIKILKNLGFELGNVNACLHVKKSVKGVVYIALCIDNNLVVRNIEAIDDAKSAFKSNWVVCKVMEGLQDYLYCETKFSEDKKRAWLGQSHLIKNMEKKFGKHLKS